MVIGASNDKQAATLTKRIGWCWDLAPVYKKIPLSDAGKAAVFEQKVLPFEILDQMHQSQRSCDSRCIVAGMLHAVYGVDCTLP